MWQSLFWLAALAAADFYATMATHRAGHWLKTRQSEPDLSRDIAMTARVVLAIFFAYFTMIGLLWRVAQIASLTSQNPYCLEWPPR